LIKVFFKKSFFDAFAQVRESRPS